MKVLVACEESQEVCKAFRALGHEAYSCDILECSGGHPEWHIQADILPLLNGNCTFTTMDGAEHMIDGKWDMIIAFVPCTKTSNAGARHLYKSGKLNIPRYYEGLCGKALFLAVWAADCEKVVIENPKPSKIFDYPRTDTGNPAVAIWTPIHKTDPAMGKGSKTSCAHKHCYSGKNLVSIRLIQRQAQ